MVVVAIAGGTGNLGKTVLDAIAKSGQHEAIVLSRTVSLPEPSSPFNQYGRTHTLQASATTAVNKPKRVAVDYTNVEQVKQALQEHKVEVVVSALVLVDDASAEAQINLIRAAAQSGTVDRFIPSEYYIDFHVPIP